MPTRIQIRKSVNIYNRVKQTWNFPRTDELKFKSI